MALWGNLPSGELACSWGGGEDLARVLVGIYLQQHEFACLINVLHLRDQGDVVGVHSGVSVDGGLIGL